MVLFLIGLGLGDEKDVTVKGLEAVKRCSKVYLEHYTSVLGVDKERLVLTPPPHHSADFFVPHGCFGGWAANALH